MLRATGHARMVNKNLAFEFLAFSQNLHCQAALAAHGSGVFKTVCPNGLVSGLT